MTDFDAGYRELTPPWDIGAPQHTFVELADQGQITGRVLDIGCGTGENALHLASGELDVLGVDIAPTAIERARTKARQRGIEARFEVRDVRHLHRVDLDGPFDCAIDCGCFHVFSDRKRPGYVRSVRRVLRAGARFFLLCFSEHEPGDWGPRRVTQRELRETFTGPFVVDEIAASHFDIGPVPDDIGPVPDAGPVVAAWLAVMTAAPG